MAEIEISGYTVLVDDEDLAKIQKYNWFINKTSRKHNPNLLYFMTHTTINKKRQMLYLHRYIMGCELHDKNIIDHISRNTLDCRKSNMRICNRAENARNITKTKINTSGYKGVSMERQTGKWNAYITYNKKHYNLGVSPTKEEAARKYDIASLLLHKDFACTNYPKETYIDIISMSKSILPEHVFALYQGDK